MVEHFRQASEFMLRGFFALENKEIEMERPNEDVKKKIIDLWNKNKGKSFESFVRENKDVDSYLNELVENDSWFLNKRRAFVCVANGIYEKKLCEACGKEIDVIKACRGRRYCSAHCTMLVEAPKRVYDDDKIARMNAKREATNLKKFGSKHPMQSKLVQDKYKKTCLEKYGVENSSQSDVIKEKVKETCLQRYGVDSHFKTEDVRNKCKQTCLEKYGVESTLSTDFVKKKSKQTMIERYGCDNPFKNNEIREKAETTCLERYGTRNVSHCPQIREKVKRTNIERYGCEYPMQNETIHQKIKNTMLERYGSKTYFQSAEYRKKIFDGFQKWKKYVVPLFTSDEYTGERTKEYLWKCVKCGNVFKQHIHTTCIDGEYGYIPRCLKCYPYCMGFSYKEKDVLDFIKSIYNGEVIENTRTIISPKELDIYLPEKHLAIEFDGFYWHSEQKGKGESYHLDKTNACAEKGIRLIHIFEDEWNLKQDIVKDRIRSILGIGQTRIFARKCVIAEIDSKTANEFLEQNHLQGGDNSSIRYGLYHDNELVSVMTFGKPRFSKSHDWELIRFASKCGCNVVGGASKLLNHFRSSHSGSIVSYADRRHSDGNLYEKLGFMQIGVSKPNYWYVRGGEKLSRYACQKHRLKDVLGDAFDPNLSEFENMSLNGWTRVHDCGNMVFVKS